MSSPRRSNSSYSQQMEDANRELEEVIAANDAFRKNVLEPAQNSSAISNNGGTTNVLPPSLSPPNLQHHYRAPGNFTNSLLAKWASVPAAAPLPSTNPILENAKNLSAAEAAVFGTNGSSAGLYRPACQCDKLDTLLQQAMLKEAARVDSQIRDTIAKDADARAQHLDNVLRGRFAELQAHSDSTGKVLQMIAESLKTVKQESAQLAKSLEDKTSKTVEAVKEQQKDHSDRLASVVERMEQRLSVLEATMHQERVQRQTRLDSLELKMQEMRSMMFSQIERKNQELRDDLRSLDSDFAGLHREFTKATNSAEDLRHLKHAMRELIEDTTGLRSDMRQVKSDVLNLDVFLKMKNQNTGFALFERSKNTNSNTNHSDPHNSKDATSSKKQQAYEDIQTLRESVSYLAAAMKHHGILSIEGPSIYAEVFCGGANNNNNQQQYRNASSHNGRSAASGNFTTTSTRQPAPKSSYDFLYNNNNNKGQNDEDDFVENPSYRNNNNNKQYSNPVEEAAAAAHAFRNSVNRASSSSPYQNNNNNTAAARRSSTPKGAGTYEYNEGSNEIPPLAGGTPKHQTSSFNFNNNQQQQQQRKKNYGSFNQDVGEDFGERQPDNNNNDESEDGTLPSADDDDRLVRSPID
jgi:hypothetical protein